MRANDVAVNYSYEKQIGMTRALLSGFQMNNPELIAPVNLSDHLHYDMEE